MAYRPTSEEGNPPEGQAPRSRLSSGSSSKRTSQRRRRTSRILKRSSARLRPVLVQATDVSLVQAATKGERLAFEELMRRHQNAVRLLVRKLLEELDLVEDVTQDVFLKAYAHLSKLERPERFRSWLMQIAANRARDCLRWERRRQASLVDTDRHRPHRPRVAARAALDLSMGEASGPFETQELHSKIVSEIASLPPRYRAVALAAYLEEKSPAEIAVQSGLSEETVKHRLRRAREKLRFRLRQWKPGAGGRKGD